MEGEPLSLQEATELSALFLQVENVFASGNVPAIAETLATMRRSLLLVGDVPEFKGGMQRLEVSSHQTFYMTHRLLNVLHLLFWEQC